MLKNCVILNDSPMFFQDGPYEFVCLIESYDEWENTVCMSVGFISIEKVILCKGFFETHC